MMLADGLGVMHMLQLVGLSNIKVVISSSKVKRFKAHSFASIIFPVRSGLLLRVVPLGSPSKF